GKVIWNGLTFADVTPVTQMREMHYIDCRFTGAQTPNGYSPATSLSQLVRYLNTVIESQSAFTIDKLCDTVILDNVMLTQPFLQSANNKLIVRNSFIDQLTQVRNLDVSNSYVRQLTASTTYGINQSLTVRDSVINSYANIGSTKFFLPASKVSNGIITISKI